MSLAIAIILLSHFTSVALGLTTAPGSPCADVCNKGSTNTTGSEIVCLDQQYNSTSKGTNFQKCVECELKSDYSDDNSGESDVDWGLYNLRYAFTTCVYGYPKEVVNISSPCVVSCDSLSPALEDNLMNPSSTNFDTFCGSTAFADNVVDTCEFCYNLTTTQVYLANFLEAIRYNCHIRTVSGTAFAISPTRIFTQSMLPSTLSFPSSSPSGVQHLGVIIALPIVAFVILLGATAVCCFFFIRHRRRKLRRNRHSDHLHARWHDTSISTPFPGAWGQYPAQQDVYSPAMYPGGYGPGFGFVDNDGHGQNVGYSKSHVELGVAVTSMDQSEQEKENSAPYRDSPQKE